MAGSADADWKPKSNPWWIAIAVMMATFMEVMDTSIASVALPNIAGSISATNDEATWVLTSYLVANAIFIPASTWLSLKFGRKRYLITSVLVFTAASFACGAANSLTFILVARAIQGAAGGALQPLALAILLESFPPAKKGMALGMFTVGVVVAPVIGPALGGYLTDQISWRWAFYINIPIGLLAAFLQSRVLEDPPFIKNTKPGRLDIIGLSFLALGLGALQIVCHPLDGGPVCCRSHCVDHSRTHSRRAVSEPPHLSEPELRHRLRPGRAVWRMYLWRDIHLAPLLPDIAGV